MAVNRDLVARAEIGDASERVVLDMDSPGSPVRGQHESSAYNGHFRYCHVNAPGVRLTR